MSEKETIEQRLARIESRLCQLMLHVGIDPDARARTTVHRVPLNTVGQKQQKR